MLTPNRTSWNRQRASARTVRRLRHAWLRSSTLTSSILPFGLSGAADGARRRTACAGVLVGGSGRLHDAGASAGRPTAAGGGRLTPSPTRSTTSATRCRRCTSVFLSIFALFPGFPLTAQIAQVVPRSHRSCSSSRSDAGCTRSPRDSSRPGVRAVGAQHLQRLVDVARDAIRPADPRVVSPAGPRARRTRTPGRLSLAGVAFGAAALTRSMPLFFVLPAAALHVGRMVRTDGGAAGCRVRRSALRCLRRPIQSRCRATRPDHHHRHTWQHPPRIGPRHPSAGPFETAAGCGVRSARDPETYFSGCVARARSLLHVNGGRILQIYVVAESKASAVLWKTLVHLGADMLLIVGAILAGLGAALCRRRNLAAFLLLWAAINIGIASLGGFGGARLRAPFEPLLAILAAVVFAGAWQRPRPVGARRSDRNWRPRCYRCPAAVAREPSLVAGLWHGVAVDLQPAVRDIYVSRGPQRAGIRRTRRLRRHFQRAVCDSTAGSGWRRTRQRCHAGRGRDDNDPARCGRPADSHTSSSISEAPANESAVIAVTVPVR